MKKIVKICALLLVVAAFFTACQYENWGENSGPTVDIVERSDLLDIVNLDYILDDGRVQQLAESGLTPSMKDFHLTGDYSAAFDFTLINSAGKQTTIPVNCLLSYDKHTTGGKDSFSNVKVYWGNLDVFGDDIVITNMNNAQVLSVENPETVKKEMDLSFLGELGGYALNVAPVADGYVYAYYSLTDSGIAIFDANGTLDRKITMATEGLTNSFATVTDAFNIETTPLIHTSDNGMIYLIGTQHSVGGKNAYLYDMANDISYGRNGVFIYDDLVADGTSYAMKYFYNESTGDNVFTAAKFGADGITDFMAFKEDENLTGFAHYIGQSMQLDENGNLRFDCAGAGLSLTVDFAQDTVTKQFNITEDMLGEKLYTSQDRKYGLYEFAPFSYPNMSASNIALKEESTGRIKYIGLMDIISGEVSAPDTGFFSNGDIYLLTAENFAVFDRDMDNTQPVFSMADNFPLGNGVPEDNISRRLCAVRRNSDNSYYAVYYDWNYSDSERYINGNQLKAAYQIAVLDKDGNMVSTYDTGVNVFVGYRPVNMYLRGNTLHISVMHMGTDHALVKFDFNTKTGKTDITQRYTPPQQ